MARRLNVCVNLGTLMKDKLCPEVLHLLETIRPSWCKTVNRENVEENEENVTGNIKYKVLTGGLSNYMVAYYKNDIDEKDTVIVRINGEETVDHCLDKENEIENIKVLHKAGRGPPLYAVFNNGMSHGFVKGITLDESMIREPHIQRLIAQEILAFHRVKVPDGREEEPRIWKLFHDLLDLAPSVYNDPKKNTILREHIRPKDVLREELHCLKHHLDQLQSPLVFCHNDLRPSNILYDKSNDCVTFIDVELAMYNNEHFEIGSHFIEHAGTNEMDFKKYPNKEYQLSWIRYYLEQKVILNGGSSTEVTDRDVENFYVKVNQFSLAPSLGWAIWGLVMAERSHIDFDYLEYAKKRFDVYFSRKEEVLSWTLRD